MYDCFGNSINVLTTNGLCFNCCVLTQITILVNNMKHLPSVITMKLFLKFLFPFNIPTMTFYPCHVGIEASRHRRSYLTR